jgi:hypothetical protein
MSTAPPVSLNLVPGSRRNATWLLPADQQFTVELVPYCTSVTRDGWTGSHDVCLLAELGIRQASV